MTTPAECGHCRQRFDYDDTAARSRHAECGIDFASVVAQAEEEALAGYPLGSHLPRGG